MRFIRRLNKLNFEQRLVYLAPLTISFSTMVCIGKFLFAYFKLVVNLGCKMAG